MDIQLHHILCQELAPLLGVTLTPEVLAQVVGSTMGRCYPGPIDTRAIAPQRVGSYTLYCARIVDLLDELRHLHAEHWQETETHRPDVAMDPDYERVMDLEQQGRYFLIVARHDDGTLVGNYGSYLARSTHTKLMTATEDTLFISAAHRRGRLGVAMIRYCENTLRALGVAELNVSVKLVNHVGPMLERMGYTPTGTQYTKLLTEMAHVLP